jgi:hypothetical protein
LTSCRKAALDKGGADERDHRLAVLVEVGGTKTQASPGTVITGESGLIQ